MKRIRLTIEAEWAGACGEETWANVLTEAIEAFDVSGLTKVTQVKLVTDFGTTEPITVVEPDRKHQRFIG